MINNLTNFLLKKNTSLLSNFVRYYFYLFFFSTLTLLFSCSPTERFTKNVETTTAAIPSALRVLISELQPSEVILVDSPVELYNESTKLSHIDSGTKVKCFSDNDKINLKYEDKNLSAAKFFLSPTNNVEGIKINGKKYRGKIQISVSDNSIHVINIISLEDYVKGVLAKEMPVGKNNENFEALKALAVCIRTYAIKKVQDGKIYFDLFADTRDQVYGGVDSENLLTNKAVDETTELILKYKGNIATLYYHSTCGGYTESSENVFTKEPLPYLQSIKDGDDIYCKISPRFQWEETYTKEKIIDRLKDYSLLDEGNYKLQDFSIIDRFKSGRVAELEIKVSNTNENEKTLILRGNEIRSILRTSDNRNILWSTMFDVSINSDSIILTGKGFGHGVGLCQWGAIGMSRNGKSYKEILQHYYPGTRIIKVND